MESWLGLFENQTMSLPFLSKTPTFTKDANINLVRHLIKLKNSDGVEAVCCHHNVCTCV